MGISSIRAKIYGRRCVTALTGVVLLSLATSCKNQPNPCTVDTDCPSGELCEEGLCTKTSCRSSSDCDDNDPCTKDICFKEGNTFSCVNSKECGATTVDCSCNDDDLCTELDICLDSGACEGSPIRCDTGETCDPATGLCVGGDTTLTTALLESLGDYVGTPDCNGETVQVTIGLDAGTFFVVGLDGENRTFFPDGSEKDLTATATDVDVFGTSGNSVTLTVDADTGDITLERVMHF